jgi:hypothetical protein
MFLWKKKKLSDENTSLPQSAKAIYVFYNLMRQDIGTRNYMAK